MRSIPAFVAAAALGALGALAGCGPGSGSSPYAKADGSFDRAAYRADVEESCRAGAAAGASPPPPEAADRFCACVSERILQQPDAELLAEAGDRTLDKANQEEAFRYCARANQAAAQGSGGSAGPIDGGDVPDAEPPPPPDLAPPGEALVPGATAARARANLPSYFSADDYPAAALRNGEQGRVGITLQVGADGRVANCIVTESSGSASLDSTTCQILRRRARYTPARDARGQVTAGEHRASVQWRLPSG